MAAPPPVLDRRSYQEIVDETISRIGVHNPEWTNHNESDPGVTILELFAFMTESIVYRANQIPERSRRKFLDLLRVPLAPASSAHGIVTIANERGIFDTETLNSDLEVRAGAVPFRTELGLDVLPVEGRVYFKRTVREVPDRLRRYYQQLYASYTGPDKPSLEDLTLYETVPLDAQSAAGVSLQATADRSLWVALLMREVDEAGGESRDAVRGKLAGRTLSIGVVPILDNPRADLTPTGRNGRSDPTGQLDAFVPNLAVEGLAHYLKIDITWRNDVLALPGILQITLPPDRDQLQTWDALDPLEAGVGDLPPSLDDTKLEARVITWIRLQAALGTRADVLWAGINATTVTQRTRVVGEALPAGTGDPEQSFRLANAPVIPASARLTVGAEQWTRVDDLLAAAPEIPLRDARSTPGTKAPPEGNPNVFALDPASGRIEFGDGEHGRRPAAGAAIRVSYDFGSGSAGNVGAGAIAQAPALPAGFSVTNAIRTWGGAEADSVEKGEKIAARSLQNRNRLVTTEDFETIVWQTPGIDLGRVEVIPAYNPELGNEPGDAAGVVTVLVIPRVDPTQVAAPEPDQPFLDAICDYIDPRRLVTTEVFLRGPVYRSLWLTIGIEVVAGASIAEVRERVKAAVRRFLAPVDPDAPPWWSDEPLSVDQPFVHPSRGWPLGKAVSALELAAVASRVDGVVFVRGVNLAEGANAPIPQGGSIPMSGLQLPQLLGLDVAAGDAPSLDALRGTPGPQGPAPPATSFPVPVIPDTC